MSCSPLKINNYKEKSELITDQNIREDYNRDDEDILNYNYNNTLFNTAKENENNLLKTGKNKQFFSYQ